MALSEQAKQAVRKEAEKHSEKTLVRQLKFMRAGSQMLQLAFKDGTNKDLKFGTPEGRDFMFETMKELHGWNKNLNNSQQSIE